MLHVNRKMDDKQGCNVSSFQVIIIVQINETYLLHSTQQSLFKLSIFVLTAVERGRGAAHWHRSLKWLRSLISNSDMLIY